MIISPRVSCPIVLSISQLSLIEILVPGGPGTGSAVPHMQKILHVYRPEGLYNREFAKNDHFQIPYSTISAVTAHIHCPKPHPSFVMLKLMTSTTPHAHHLRLTILLLLQRGLVNNPRPSLQFESVMTQMLTGHLLQVHPVWEPLASPRRTRSPAPVLPHLDRLPSMLMTVPLFNFGV